MASRASLRSFWFSVHKWIGLSLVILIIPIALSGSALVWHDWLDGVLNPQRHVAETARADLPVDRYIAAATASLRPGEAISGIRLAEQGEAVVVTAAQPPRRGAGRPVRTQIWIDPETARVVDRANSDAGFVRVMHVLHGSLMVPGLGRQVVGWVGVFMFVSCLSGLWIWLPTIGRWTRGFAWRRERTFSTNLHHQAGFWIAIPLAMLSFTGAWISFPAFFGQFSGQQARPAPGPDRMARMRARPLAVTVQTPAQAIAAAGSVAAGKVVGLNWPTEVEPVWRVSVAGAKGDVEVADATGVAGRAAPPPAGGIARTMRQWHDGGGMGPVWQTVIFVGGLIPALLGVTGLIMWWKTRVWRGRIARRSAAREHAPA